MLDRRTATKSAGDQNRSWRMRSLGDMHGELDQRRAKSVKDKRSVFNRPREGRDHHFAEATAHRHAGASSI